MIDKAEPIHGGKGTPILVPGVKQGNRAIERLPEARVRTGTQQRGIHTVSGSVRRKGNAALAARPIVPRP